MPKIRNSFLLLFFFLAVVSLACLTTTEPIVTPTPITESTEVAAAVLATPSVPTPTNAKQACLVISADEALNLREKPDPHSQSLAFMLGGEVVKLISITNEDWWLIKRGNLTGYARSKYLDFAQCK